MTGEERGQDHSGQAPDQERPRAVVVAVDPARLALYARTLRIAEMPNLATLDLDEAEQLLIEHQPTVLVLDYGLPRIYILRLYGLVREGMDGPRVKVLFVGQAGDAASDGGGSDGADDYYLPGEPSPLGVAAQVCEIVAEADAPPAEARDGPAATPDPDAPAARTEPPASDASDTDQGALESDQSAPGATAPAPEAEPVVAGPAPAPLVAGSPVAAAAGMTAARKPGLRFDVLMFRVGMALLILGGLLAFLRPESFTLPMMAPPTVVPTPAPQPPAVSPSPAAFMLPGDASVSPSVRVAVGRA